MSLTSALSNALSGLRANQTSVDLVSRNVSNAGTAGYTRKTLPLESAAVEGDGRGVRTAAVQREIDLGVQRSLRNEQASQARLGVMDDMMQRLTDMYGKPDAQMSLAASVKGLSTSFQKLADNPDLASVRQSVLGAAGSLASDLNRMSTTVQDMRLEAEGQIGQSVDAVNEALRNTAKLNEQIVSRARLGESTAELEDQRDKSLNVVSEQLGARIVRQTSGEVQIFTQSGRTLLDGSPRELKFDQRSTMTPESLYAAPPAPRGVGTITLVDGDGEHDLLAESAIPGGRIGGLVEMRDRALVDAQNQLDELAGGLALSLSQTTVKGAVADYGAATPSAATPLTAQLDTSAVLTPGDSVTLRWQDSGGEARSLTLTGSKESPPPRGSFSIGSDPLITRDNIASALGQAMTDAGVPFSTRGSGSSVVVEDAADDGFNLVGFEAVSQSGSRQPGQTGLALFADGAGAGQRAYTGQTQAGFAQRIAVSNAVTADDRSLVRYPLADGSLAAIGDSTRPLALLSRMSEAGRSFGGSTGLGTARTSVEGYAIQLVSYQANQTAEIGDRLAYQSSITSTLDQRFTSSSGVNIDDEMANLLVLEKAYAANSQVFSTVQKMLDDLLNIVH